MEARETTLFGSTKNRAANGNGLAGLTRLSPSRPGGIDRQGAVGEASRSLQPTVAEGGYGGEGDKERSRVEWSCNYFLHCLTKYGQGGGETRHRSSPAKWGRCMFQMLGFPQSTRHLAEPSAQLGKKDTGCLVGLLHLTGCQCVGPLIYALSATTASLLDLSLVKR